MIYNNPHKYLINADFTINITTESLKQLLSQILSEQFNCVISSKDIEFDVGTTTKGYGMSEYNVTEFKGCKVNVRATDQAAAASSITYRSPSVVVDGVERDYSDCIYGCSDEAEAICNNIASYGLAVEGVSTTEAIKHLASVAGVSTAEATEHLASIARTSVDGVFQTASTPTVTAKKIDDCNVIG